MENMNWDAIGAVAEFLAALGVIASLIYVARQVHSSRTTAADTNRLTRTEGVCQMLHSYATNDDVRNATIDANGLKTAYEKMAAELGVPYDVAARSDFTNAYWFWLHWGQYASTTDERDLQELKNAMIGYVALPAMNYSWHNSFVAKPMLDKEFIEFAEETMAEHEKVLSKRPPPYR